MKKVGVLGATGFAGVELCRLLAQHPLVKLTALGSNSFVGKTLAAVYPALTGIIDLPLCTTEEVVDKSDIVFASLPHGFSQEIAAQVLRQGKVFIDLGADFRLQNEADYKEWYQGEFLDKKMHEIAVYGLPELYAEAIKKTTLVANPGCYPTATILGLAPLAQAQKIVLDSVVIDAKSGVTGAGRNATEQTHFAHCNEGFRPYKIGEHRHIPEIEQTLSQLLKEKITITFTPHLLPVNRGILATMYLKTKQSHTLEELAALYDEFYANKRFVKVLPLGCTASIGGVAHSNYCHISLHSDPRTGRIIVVSAIDNLLKGAAGQAVQNMNLVCGFPEETGISMIPPSF